ncbi:MAG: hypothetical protein H7318_00610 [Oligoflexus sp.]|nr:hypothetical protein [Oligoflexus sp.]
MNEIINTPNMAMPKPIALDSIVRIINQILNIVESMGLKTGLQVALFETYCRSKIASSYFYSEQGNRHEKFTREMASSCPNRFCTFL